MLESSSAGKPHMKLGEFRRRRNEPSYSIFCSNEHVRRASHFSIEEMIRSAISRRTGGQQGVGLVTPSCPRLVLHPRAGRKML